MMMTFISVEICIVQEMRTHYYQLDWFIQCPGFSTTDCRYRVIVKTGSRINDGTNARVFVQLFGSAATCPWRELKSSNGFRPKS